MDSRIKIEYMCYYMQDRRIVSILVLMDSRIKIRIFSIYLYSVLFVSILVLMDSRIKILISYTGIVISI